MEDLEQIKKLLSQYLENDLSQLDRNLLLGIYQFNKIDDAELVPVGEN